MDSVKERAYFPFLLFLAAAVAFWDVFLLRSALVCGDYSRQFYPWLNFYSENIKNFHLPLWTRYVQSGFPIFAEGQTGMLYPLNLFFFFIMPFKLAYNYSFLFHFFLAGIFMYMYAREMKLGVFGASLASIVLCFGSAYAGASINLPTLNALCYFPLILLIFEKSLKAIAGKIGLFILIGLIWGVQFLTGSFQMASYNVIFCVLYFLFRNISEKKSVISLGKYAFLSLVVAILISLPQILPTLELAGYSGRSARTVDFALWNSFSPLAIAGTLIPAFGSIFIRTNVIYIGVLGLFFTFVSLSYYKKDNTVKVFLFLAVAGLFVALGKYNPLYVLLLKLANFYSFRGPAKTVYFVMFALAILAGKGFHYFLSTGDASPVKRAYRNFVIFFALVFTFFCAFKVFLSLFGRQILEIAKTYVTNHVYGQSFHKYSLDHYISKTDDIFNSLALKLSFSNFYLVYGLVLAAAIILLVWALLMKREKRYVKYICVAVIFFDLLVMSFYFDGPRSNMGRFDSVKISHKRIFDKLKSDKELFRIYPFGKGELLPEWSYFSMNMAYSLDGIGLYTPLMNRDYYLKLEDLGIVDDSLGALEAKKSVIGEKKDLLEKLNVKYILSSEKLEYDFLEESDFEDGVYLYLVSSYYPRFWFEPKASLNIMEYGSGHAELDIDVEKDGFLVFSEKYYPGWQAFLDGKKTDIVRYIDILQAVPVSKGKHTLTFRFKPQYLGKFFLVQGLTVFLLLLYGAYRVGERYKASKNVK